MQQTTTRWLTLGLILLLPIIAQAKALIIKAPTTGHVSKIFVAPQQTVAQNSLLLQFVANEKTVIDAAAVQAASMTLTNAQAAYTAQKTHYLELFETAEKEGYDKQEMQAQAELLREKQASVTAAEAALAKAKSTRHTQKGETSQLRAPSAGIVKAVYVKPGQAITVGQSLLALQPKS